MILGQPSCHLPLAAQYQYLRIKYYTSYSSIREPWKKLRRAMCALKMRASNCECKSWARQCCVYEAAMLTGI